jgi:modulator of FtsH protease HflK
MNASSLPSKTPVSEALAALGALLVWFPRKAAHQALGMFNLNDGRWGRGDDKPAEGGNGGGESNKPSGDGASPPPPSDRSPDRNTGSGGGGNNQGPNQGPPDLDELWRDFNKKLGGLFGGNRGGNNNAGGNQPDWGRHNNNRGGGSGGGGGFQPDMKAAGFGAGLIGAIAVLIWLGTGFFIVQEGQQAVVTRFGKFTGTVEAGINWRLPYPFESHETVPLTQLRSVEIGRSSTLSNGLRDSSMLTQDENIVDVRLTVQYLLKSAPDYLFQNNNPDDAVVKAAESAVREVVGRAVMDTVLYRDRNQIQSDVMKSVQAQLDRYKTGILIQNVNIQNVQPPEAVQAAFDDALKAGQDGDRLKNEGLAYANDVIPRARGTASRLKEEAEGHKARVVAQAEGDAQRFRAVYAEYAKAPQVTRDRLYIDAMQQIYSNVTKVMVDSRQGNQLLYLPLDKLMQTTVPNPAEITTITPGNSNGLPSIPPSAAPAAPTAPAGATGDRARARDRDSR